MSHDCDCDDCKSTDSRWAPWRASERAKKEDCPFGRHVARLWRARADVCEYRCLHCDVIVTVEGVSQQDRTHRNAFGHFVTTGLAFATKCVFCNLPIGTEIVPEPANDTEVVLEEIRAAELAESIATPLVTKVPRMTMEEFMDWMDVDAEKVGGAGYLARQIVFHGKPSDWEISSDAEE